MNDTSVKVTVTFERRGDGGLRAWSEDVPGLVLSHVNVEGVLEDVKTALETILSERFGQTVIAQPLVELKEHLAKNGVVARDFFVLGPKEYVAYVH